MISNHLMEHMCGSMDCISSEKRAIAQNQGYILYTYFAIKTLTPVSKTKIVEISDGKYLYVYQKFKIFLWSEDQEVSDTCFNISVSLIAKFETFDHVFYQ